MITNVTAAPQARYARQKHWLARCGVRHVIYLVEGDPDLMTEGQKQVKTAAAAVEVLDGFRVSSGISGETAGLC